MLKNKDENDRVGTGKKERVMTMARVIGFKNKDKNLPEDETHSLEIQELEDKIEKEMDVLRQRAMIHGVNSITDEDIRNVQNLMFRVNLLYDVVAIISGEDDGA